VPLFDAYPDDPYDELVLDPELDSRPTDPEDQP